jgi:hypothetical protein
MLPESHVEIEYIMRNFKLVCGFTGVKNVGYCATGPFSLTSEKSPFPKSFNGCTETSMPLALSSAAATALSTPPLMAVSTLFPNMVMPRILVY